MVTSTEEIQVHSKSISKEELLYSIRECIEKILDSKHVEPLYVINLTNRFVKNTQDESLLEPFIKGTKVQTKKYLKTRLLEIKALICKYESIEVNEETVFLPDDQVKKLKTKEQQDSNGSIRNNKNIEKQTKKEKKSVRSTKSLKIISAKVFGSFIKQFDLLKDIENISKILEECYETITLLDKCLKPCNRTFHFNDKKTSMCEFWFKKTLKSFLRENIFSLNVLITGAYMYIDTELSKVSSFENYKETTNSLVSHQTILKKLSGKLKSIYINGSIITNKLIISNAIEVLSPRIDAFSFIFSFFKYQKLAYSKGKKKYIKNNILKKLYFEYPVAKLSKCILNEIGNLQNISPEYKRDEECKCDRYDSSIDKEEYKYGEADNPVDKEEKRKGNKVDSSIDKEDPKYNSIYSSLQKEKLYDFFSSSQSDKAIYEQFLMSPTELPYNYDLLGNTDIYVISNSTNLEYLEKIEEQAIKFKDFKIIVTSTITHLRPFLCIYKLFKYCKCQSKLWDAIKLVLDIKLTKESFIDSVYCITAIQEIVKKINDEAFSKNFNNFLKGFLEVHQNSTEISNFLDNIYLLNINRMIEYEILRKANQINNYKVNSSDLINNVKVNSPDLINNVKVNTPDLIDNDNSNSPDLINIGKVNSLDLIDNYKSNNLDPINSSTKNEKNDTLSLDAEGNKNSINCLTDHKIFNNETTSKDLDSLDNSDKKAKNSHMNLLTQISVSQYASLFESINFLIESAIDPGAFLSDLQLKLSKRLLAYRHMNDYSRVFIYNELLFLSFLKPMYRENMLKMIFDTVDSMTANIAHKLDLESILTKNSFTMMLMTMCKWPHFKDVPVAIDKLNFIKQELSNHMKTKSKRLSFYDSLSSSTILLFDKTIKVTLFQYSVIQRIIDTGICISIRDFFSKANESGMKDIITISESKEKMQNLNNSYGSTVYVKKFDIPQFYHSQFTKLLNNLIVEIEDCYFINPFFKPSSFIDINPVLLSATENGDDQSTVSYRFVNYARISKYMKKNRSVSLESLSLEMTDLSKENILECLKYLEDKGMVDVKNDVISYIP